MRIPKRDGVRWQICGWVEESFRIRSAQLLPVPQSLNKWYHHNSSSSSSSWCSRIPNSRTRMLNLRSLAGIVISALLALIMMLRKVLLASSRMVHQRWQPRIQLIACINRLREWVKILTSIATNNKPPRVRKRVNLSLHRNNEIL